MKKVLAVAALVVAASTAVACGTASSGNGQATVIHLDASWLRAYTDFRSLKHDSDVAVEGRFVAVTDQTSDLSEPLKQVPFTDFQFQVTTAVYDPRALAAIGSTILIHQTGARVGSVLAQVDDDPLFTVGERAVLFLHEYAQGRYFVIGGPTGRFSVSNTGMVRPINDEGVQMSPAPEADFIALVKAA